MLLTAGVSLQVGRIRGKTPGARLWMWTAAGFLVLTCDQAFALHGRIDDSIHQMLGMRETAWTDRIDDLVVLLYGVCGAVVLWLYRREWLGLQRMHRPLVLGGCCFVLALIANAAGDRYDVAVWLLGENRAARVLQSFFSIGDEGFKLVGVGLFLSAFHAAYTAAVRMRVPCAEEPKVRIAKAKFGR